MIRALLARLFKRPLVAGELRDIRTVNTGGTARPSGSLSALLIPGVPKVDGLTHKNLLDILCETHGAKYDRTEEDNGHTKVVRVHLPTGDVLSARGPTTEDAVREMALRLEWWKSGRPQ